MIYAYVRVSTPSQSVDRQCRNILHEYPDAKLYIEKYTGTTLERPEWMRLCSVVKKGDTVVFDSVSRMSRNAEEGFNAYQKFYSDDVSLIFLKEPHINTNVYKKSAAKAVPMTGTSVDIILEAVNRYLMELAKEQIRLAFEQSQKEVDDLHKRTSEGMLTAKLNGKQIGRKPGAIITSQKSIKAKEIIQKHSKSFGGTLNDSEVIKLCGITRNAYYKYKKELRS